MHNCIKTNYVEEHIYLSRGNIKWKEMKMMHSQHFNKTKSKNYSSYYLISSMYSKSFSVSDFSSIFSFSIETLKKKKHTLIYTIIILTLYQNKHLWYGVRIILCRVSLLYRDAYSMADTVLSGRLTLGSKLLTINLCDRSCWQFMQVGGSSLLLFKWESFPNIFWQKAYDDESLYTVTDL